MAVWIDRKYLLLISSRLRNFRQKKDDLFNFSCPFCGDSKKNKLKASGYIYRKNNDYFYVCHNCGVGTTFFKFLKHNDEESARQYALERYTEGHIGNHNYTKPVVFTRTGKNPFEVFDSKKLSLETIRDKIPNINILQDGHPARLYVEQRKIPETFWNEVFFASNFKEFMDDVFPDHGKENVPSDARVVLFYTNEKGEITNVAGRALGKSPIRYCTIKVTDDKKMFGLHRVRKSERIYVVEGQFDSFFIPNCIASGDSNLCGVANHLSDCDVTLIFDKEPRNKEIVKQIEQSIENGYNVCLLPEELPGKDINEMIINDMAASELKRIIDENTFQGLEAKLRLTQWKKC